MKGGTEYARRVKKLFTRLKKKYGPPVRGEPSDPLRQAMLGILHNGTTVAQAENALTVLMSAMVDINELRVSTPSELIELLGPDFPHATEKAKAIIKLLNVAYARYNELNLNDLVNLGKRDARQTLMGFEGIDPASAAGVVLLSLEGHAIPVDEVSLAVLRKERLVDQDADVAEVQAFLERNIPAASGNGFTQLLRRHSEEHVTRFGPILPEPEQPAEAEETAIRKPRKKRAKAARKTARKGASSVKKKAPRKKRATSKTTRAPKKAASTSSSRARKATAKKKAAAKS